MEDTYEIKKSLNESVLDAYVAEYAMQTDIWKGLETKAQGSVTIAGIFVASSFVFIRDLNTLQLTSNQRLLLGFSFFCLVLSVVCSILVLTLRNVKPPPTGAMVKQIITDITTLKKGETEDQLEALLPQLNLNHFNQKVKIWEKAIESAGSRIRFKVGCLGIAQWLLVCAIVSIVWITLSIINR